jgi:hypothetical protein
MPDPLALKNKYGTGTYGTAKYSAGTQNADPDPASHFDTDAEPSFSHSIHFGLSSEN